MGQTPLDRSARGSIDGTVIWERGTTGTERNWERRSGETTAGNKGARSDRPGDRIGAIGSGRVEALCHVPPCLIFRRCFRRCVLLLLPSVTELQWLLERSRAGDASWWKVGKARPMHVREVAGRFARPSVGKAAPHEPSR
jgi:hypothetical protein